ncbi:Purine nucleoside phosphorylase [Friedmanniomyces endolithicus]|nr:Purine nucleoside phosphorylase [Friedmanniomyces endolithicus]
MEMLHNLASLYHSLTHIHHTLGDAHDEMTTSTFHRAIQTVEHLRLTLPAQLAKPRVAIVCGSGLGGLAETVDGKVREEWAYGDVPGFPVSTGYNMDTVTFATRVCKLLGVETMLLTNAAGGLNPDYSVGDIVCLNDHLNLAGLVGFHPLRGPNEQDFGVRFPPLSDAYDISLRQLAHRSWQGLRQQQPSERRMHEGVYAFVTGPSYETRAECRMLRQMGADVVGMSTVPEIIVARHSGMRVLAFSLVTNSTVQTPVVRADDPELQGLSQAELDEYMSRGRANHEEVLEAGRLAAVDMQGLVLRIVAEL